ncbi:MAG: precorrin-6y C5,15-methyltransferase (decarboxylating) subunit CbiE [Anaerolineae bacterium]
MNHTPPSPSSRIVVIGTGVQSVSALPANTLARIQAADWLIGGKRLLAECERAGLCRADALRIPLSAEIDTVIERLRRRGQARVVVLASGDPGFHGIAGTLLKHFPSAEIEIIPNVTSLQAAFARAGLDWSDAILTSAHAHPLSRIIGWARRARVIGILTDPHHTPAVIAQALLSAGIEDSRAIVAENLGLPDERLSEARLSELVNQTHAALSVLLLARDAGWQPQPVFAPRPDEAYAHRRGLITKAEVRALTLAQLALRETDTVWDIGAGSGAVSIEMGALAWHGRVYAVEQDAENLSYLRENILRYGAANVDIVAGAAPDALDGLPAPDAVFIGGAGGALRPILRVALQRARPGARLALNLATLEHACEAWALLRQADLSPAMTQVNIARAQTLAARTDEMSLTRLAPLNPVFIISAQLKPGEHESRTV